MARLLAVFVHVVGEDGENVVLAPGSKVPGWAKDQVTNPKAFASTGDDKDEDTAPAAVADDLAGEYEDESFSVLQSIAKARSLSGQGNKAALVARLEADDREKAAELDAAAALAAADIAATTSTITE